MTVVAPVHGSSRRWQRRVGVECPVEEKIGKLLRIAKRATKRQRRALSIATHVCHFVGSAKLPRAETKRDRDV